jgi:hypothetical protein
MLVRAFAFLDPAHIFSDLSERLHSLGRDCGLLYRGAGVPAEALDDAPLLQDWVPVLTTEGVKLAGYATGHPVHGNRTVMTTPLWWADPSGKWVRSLSRFYRLAGCADDGVFAGREDRP